MFISGNDLWFRRLQRKHVPPSPYHFHIFPLYSHGRRFLFFFFFTLSRPCVLLLWLLHLIVHRFHLVSLFQLRNLYVIRFLLLSPVLQNDIFTEPGGAGGYTHDLECRRHMIVGLTSLPNRDEWRRLLTGAGSQSITNRDAP